MMRNPMVFRMAIALVLPFPLLVAGCLGKGTQTPPTFYVLSPIASAESTATTGVGDLWIGVGPVELPPHLDRPQIVTRSTANELSLTEFAQWAEPLSQGIPNAIVENLSGLLGSDRIFRQPRRVDLPIDYQVAIRILRLDAEPAGHAVLEARWVILGRDEGTVLEARTSTYNVPLGGEGPEAVVAAESRALHQLSVEIAEAIARLQSSRS